MQLKVSAIKKNIIANLFGVGVNLLNQIVLVPIYIVYWGNDLYADWLVLTSITVIFSMSDVGLNSVIQNRFAISLSQNRSQECNSLLSTNVTIVTSIFVLSLAFMGIFVSCVNLVECLGLHTINRREANIIVFLIVIRVFITMYSQIKNAVYRAKHKSSRCTYMDKTAILVCVFITIICLYSHLNMALLCAILCIPPLIVLVVKYYDSRKLFIFRFSINEVTWRLFYSLLKPSVAFFAFPIGNALILQGYTFIVNKYFGADEVVSYNTTRTMCNFIITLLGTVQAAVWPEYSIAYGVKDYSRMRSLHSKAMTTTLLGAFLISIIIIIFGPLIFHLWTKGKVEFDYSLMLVFLIAIIFKMFWTASGVTLMATNQHKTMGSVYVIGAFISFACGYYLAYNEASLIIVALTIIIAHLCLDFYTLKAGLCLTQDNIKSFILRNVKQLYRKN